MRGRDGKKARALDPARADGIPVDATLLCWPMLNKRANGPGTGPQEPAGGQDPEATGLYRPGALAALLETERPKPRPEAKGRRGKAERSGLAPMVIGDLDHLEVAEGPIAVKPRSAVRRGTSRARVRSLAALLGLGIATLCWRFWSPASERESTSQVQQARPQAGPARQKDDERGSQAASGERITRLATGKRGEPPGKEPTTGPADDSRRVTSQGQETGEEIRAAVDLLLEGRNADALALYETLADRYPEQPVYGAIARLLSRRMAEHCRQHSASMEEQCVKSR